MKSKLTNIFAGIFILFAFVQCQDAISPISEPEPSQKQNQDLTQPQLVAPQDSSSESTSLAFEWSEVKGAGSYQIQLSTAEDFSSPIVDGTADSTTFKVSALPRDTSIFWKVRPVIENEKGPWSNTRVFMTNSDGSGDNSDDGSGSSDDSGNSSDALTTSLQSPENQSSDNSVNTKLSWATVATASAYNLQIATDKSFSSIVVEQKAEEASFQTSGLSQQTTYYWRVEPIVEGQETEWSEVFNFTTEGESVATVSLISPSNKATDLETALTFEWEEVSGITDYQVQVATDNSFSSPLIDELVSKTSFETSELKSNQTYYWRAQVSTSDNTESWSEVREFKTKEAAPTQPPSTSPSGIVSASNGDFVLNGETFRFAGTNAYYLPNYEKWDPQFVNNTFDALENAGITVVRMWAFYDGYDCGYSRLDASENVIQTAPGEFSEEALRDLDNVIAKAKEHGIRIIMTLSNYWDQLGGVCQYNTWDGAANPSKNMDHFINDPDTQRWFRNYIKMLTNRVNTVTGVAYKNEPAIFSWEIMNEGHYDSQGSNPTALRNWYQEIAQFIKTQDPNHMVSTGEEGKEIGMDNTSSPYSVGEYSNTYVLRSNIGTSYKANTAIPEIDYGTAHWYPNAWGFGSTASSSVLDAQKAWLSDHIKIAEEEGKPFVLGEYGFEAGDYAQVYENLWNHAENMGLDGSLVWQYTTSGAKCNEFEGNICIGRDANLESNFKEHIQTMNNSN